MNINKSDTLQDVMRLLMVPVFIIFLSACSEEDVELDPASGGAGVDESEDEAEETEDDEDEEED